MTVRNNQNGLVYLRRSGNRQEHSLRAQLEWAMKEAARSDIALDAELGDLAYMQAGRLSQYKSIYLDDAISGSDMTRPGFLALIERFQTNKQHSHVFVFKRDRLARPEDALEMVSLEKKIRYQGVTIVMSHKTLAPLERGHASFMDDMEAYYEYFESGDFLRKLGERITGAHELLARGGYRTGGDPPYGFVRILVDAEGKELEELPTGKTVRQQGCHVRIKPKDQDKLTTWVHILDLKHRAWGNKRIAAHLSNLGIPTTSAGRSRTDHGKKHLLSTKWNPRTIAELCQNCAILGLQEYGNRAEGKFFRHGEAGPRRVGDRDRHQHGAKEGQLKIVNNDPSLVIRTEAGFEPLYDREKWDEMRELTKRRGAKQLGVPKIREPGKYPLSCRIIDLTDDCGSIFYARENGSRRLYVCGRYMKSGGIECENNTIDAEAMLKVTVETLVQKLQFGGAESKLKERLAALADVKSNTVANDPVRFEIQHLESRRDDLERSLKTVERRMSTEENDDRYKAIAATFDELKRDLTEVHGMLASLRSAKAAEASPEEEVELAFNLHRKLERILSDPSRRAELSEAFETLGVRIGLNFGSVQKKKRVTREFRGGVMVFDEGDLPVPMHGALSVAITKSSNDTVNNGVVEGVRLESPRETEGNVTAHLAERRPLGTMEGRQEGVSFTKGSRGDRI